MTKISVGGKYLINNCREVKNRYFVFIVDVFFQKSAQRVG